MSVLADKDKLNEKPPHKTLCQCKEFSHESRDNYNLKGHMKKNMGELNVHFEARYVELFKVIQEDMTCQTLLLLSSKGQEVTTETN